MSKREPANINEERAMAAERLLERKRMGLESAIEALEAVGYRVVRRDDGTFAVRAPYVRVPLPEEGTTAPSTTVPAGFLAEYPEALTAKDVSEITGLHVNSVRRLCTEGRLPSAKIGGRRLIAKSDLIALFESTGGSLK